MSNNVLTSMKRGAIIQKLTRERIDLEIHERSIRDKKLFLTNLYRFDKIYKLSRTSDNEL